MAACEGHPPLESIPSSIGIEPGPEYAVALDSARTVARRAISRMNMPGVSVAVGVGGEVIWTEGFGWSDLTEKSVVTPADIYPAGSISKSMTAVGAGVLSDRGQLDFDAPVQTYLPDFPEKPKGTITTRQLLGHIAGLQNYGAAMALRQGHCTDLRDGVAAMQEDTLLWEPGARYRYSNFGFRMVGAVMRSAADEPYPVFMQREVFEPMGMTHTVPDTAMYDLPDDLSTPYNKRSFETLRHAQPVDMSCTLAEGGYLTTPTDLVRFGFGMLDHVVLEPETVDMMWTSQTVNAGYQTGYGMGFSVQPRRLGYDDGGTPTVGHGGSTLGGRAALLILPETGMVVATMTNVRGSRVDMTGLAGFIASFFRVADETE